MKLTHGFDIALSVFAGWALADNIVSNVSCIIDHCSRDADGASRDPKRGRLLVRVLGGGEACGENVTESVEFERSDFPISRIRECLSAAESGRLTRRVPVACLPTSQNR